LVGALVAVNFGKALIAALNLALQDKTDANTGVVQYDTLFVQNPHQLLLAWKSEVVAAVVCRLVVIVCHYRFKPVLNYLLVQD
jgi:hypothetical protein